MNVNEDDLIGKPSDEVPTQDPTEDACMGKRVEKRDGETIFVGYCGAWPGKGTDHVGEGRCSRHGGSAGAPEGNDNAEGNDGGAAPEDNTNAVKHGAYADENRFYQQVLDDVLRDLVDSIFEDYVEKYEATHGEPPLGLEMELFRLSVLHVKDVVLDNWATDRPASLETSNPLVEQETEKDFVEGVGPVDQDTYKESVVLQAQKKLSTDRRQWLKDLGLLEDPESQKAEAIEGLDLSLSVEMKEDLADAFDAEPDT